MSAITINARTADKHDNFISDGSNYREPKPMEACEIGWTAITSGDTVTILPFKDHKTMILVKNTESAAEKKVTFKAGNSYHGAIADWDVTLAAGKEKWFTVDSADFVSKTTGNITITTDEATANKVYVAVLECR